MKRLEELEDHAGRTIPFTDVQLKAMATLYSNGLSTRRLADVYGISPASALRRLKAMSVKIRSRGRAEDLPRPVGDYLAICEALRIADMAHPKGYPDARVNLSSRQVRMMLADMDRLRAELECAIGDMKYAIQLVDQYKLQA